MNELLKYSDEDIKKEYWRRMKLKYPREKSDWIYWKGRISGIHIGDSIYCYIRNEYDIEPICGISNVKSVSGVRFKVNRKYIRKTSNMPKVGDIVLLRFTNHSKKPNYPEKSRIIKILRDVD